MENFKLTEKQSLTLKYLEDPNINEVLFGGGAGGGKSQCGCFWLISSCLKYPDSRWIMGRSVLKTLKETTLNSFFDLIKILEIDKTDYKYNISSGTITFNNNSQILLKDLAHKPSDPNYDELGSIEVCGAFIDECNQITHKCKEIINSRIRYKLDEFNLTPKLLMTCNPAKNWVYSEFYKPWKDNKLNENKKFVQSLAADNPYISKHYINNLYKIKDQNTKERLLFGNWEYDDDPNKLFDYNDINDLFSNCIIKEKEFYLSCDVARKGIDKTIIIIWQGFEVIEIKSYDITLVTKTAELINQFREKYKIALSNVIVDEDGVGGGVVDILKCRGFIGNASPINNNKNSNYRNLRSQCYFRFADFVKEKKIKINTSPLIEEEIKKEFQYIKDKDFDKDSKLAVISKENIKIALGKSPDYADALMMRMYFEVNKKQNHYNLSIIEY